MADTPSKPNARARIRDAALELFAERGVAATPVREVAKHAGVSAALVMHHFGSKDSLRVACDEHVAATVREQKTAAVANGADPLAAMRASAEGPPLLRYLARTLVDGSPHVAQLVDQMVVDAERYTEQGVAVGVTTPSEFPRERAVVLTVWSLGALVLHEHLARLLGVELTGDLSAGGAYVVPATEVLTRGVITEDYYQLVRAAFPSQPHQNQPQQQDAAPSQQQLHPEQPDQEES